MEQKIETGFSIISTEYTGKGGQEIFVVNCVETFK